MAWYKTKYNKTSCYSINTSESKVVYHRCSDLSSKTLNNPNKKFELYAHSHFIREFVPVKDKKDVIILPNGMYTGINVDEASRCYLVPLELKTDLKLLNLEFNKILEQDFEVFLNAKKIYKSIGNKVYKKGVLLYGPPGTGKTASIQKILTSKMPKDSIALFINNVPCQDLLTNLAEDPRLKIIVFEELCGIIREDSLAELLTFLDGETSLSNCYIIASSNYPEKLPSNLTNRPGRFDELYEVGVLSETDRKLVLSTFYKSPTAEELILTNGMTIVQLTEIILRIKRDKLSFSQATQKLRDHEELSATKFNKKTKNSDLHKGIL